MLAFRGNIKRTWRIAMLNHRTLLAVLVAGVIAAVGLSAFRSEPVARDLVNR